MMTDDLMARLIAELRHEADSGRFMDLAAPAIEAATRPPLLRRLRSRAAAVVGSVVLAVSGLGGVAYAADGAAPGDFLYGLDIALESIGIGNGGQAERLAEFETLIEEGEFEEGIEHAADHLIEDATAQDALHDAAVRVADTPAPDGVVDLLQYLGDNIGDVDGATVADLARSIGPDAPGKPEGTPGGPPEDVPGPPDSTPAGPPDGLPGGPPDPLPGRP